jgi:hypothetical protein
MSQWLSESVARVISQEILDEVGDSLNIPIEVLHLQIVSASADGSSLT